MDVGGSRKGETGSQRLCPDGSNSLGQRWHFVGSIVGPTLTNDVGATSFRSSGRRYCQRLVRC